MENDVASIAKKPAVLPKNGSKPRMVVVTQEADPTIVCVGGEVTEHSYHCTPSQRETRRHQRSNMYMEGFLSDLVQQSVAYCCSAGAYAPGVIVQQSGCTFPIKPDFTCCAPGL